MDLTVSSFFHYYMFEPTQAEKPADRIIAMVATIALGILTFGIAQLVCYFTMFNRNFTVVKDLDEKQSETLVEEKAEENNRLSSLDLSITPSVSGRVEDGSFNEEDKSQKSVNIADGPSLVGNESPHVVFNESDNENKDQVKTDSKASPLREESHDESEIEEEKKSKKKKRRNSVYKFRQKSSKSLKSLFDELKPHHH